MNIYKNAKHSNDQNAYNSKKCILSFFERRAHSSVTEFPQVRLELLNIIPWALNDKVGDQFKG